MSQVNSFEGEAFRRPPSHVWPPAAGSRLLKRGEYIGNRDLHVRRSCRNRLVQRREKACHVWVRIVGRIVVHHNDRTVKPGVRRLVRMDSRLAVTAANTWCNPAAIYVGRYTHRGALSNHRLLAIEDGQRKRNCSHIRLRAKAQGMKRLLMEVSRFICAAALAQSQSVLS